ncbi:MAG: thiazole synthase [Rubripirellula sp.]
MSQQPNHGTTSNTNRLHLSNDPTIADDRPLTIGTHTLASRMIVGTGRYDTMDQMRASLDASGADCVTVAVRRERLYDKSGQNILDFLDLDRYILLPNTAGCYTAADAIRAAKLGREILRTLGNPGADWVKLEVLGDSKTLLPDPTETLAACRELAADGFQVLCYTSDCPVTAQKLKAAGAASVMPAGSPIGSGQGLLNVNNLKIILEYLKEDDADYPVIIDAGVGTASDISEAFELGADGVLLNTAIAHARDPIRMARAMKYATLAGRDAYLSGRIPKRLYGTASSPTEGVISTRPYGSQA